MARTRKTHIRHPKVPKESVCQREGVEFASQQSQATCKTCRAMAVEGQLRTLEFEHNADKWEGYNYTGEPRYTEKQVKFSQHPQVTVNAKQAALDVGYSKSFAKTQANALRRQLAPLILEVQEKAKLLAAISVSRIQTELAAMGFANVLDYFNVDDNGMLHSKQLNELTRAQAAAITEVKLMELEDPLTGEVKYVIESVKLADKRANLVELGRTLGMFNQVKLEDKRESTLLLQEVPTEKLEEAEALLMDAVKVARTQRSKNEAIPGEFQKLPSPEKEKK